MLYVYQLYITLTTCTDYMVQFNLSGSNIITADIMARTLFYVQVITQ